MKCDDMQYGRSSNPQRHDKKVRQRRRDKYNYEVAQYNYYNQRKKVVRNIMNENNNKVCMININTLEDHFKENFEKSNKSKLESYGTKQTSPDIIVNSEDVENAIKSLSYDTSAGTDRVLARTIKSMKVSNVIKTIIEIMLNTSFVPENFRIGRTILIDKGGDTASINNWRPITIYSILRRVIEKVLDKKLRDEIDLHSHQRGFITGVPDCHVNAKIINACLQDAKKHKRDCVITFLDIVGAFDHIGHTHVEKSLEAMAVPENLRNLISSYYAKYHCY